MKAERKPHKWAEVIKTWADAIHAWADGADIQFKTGGTWKDYDNSERLPDFNFGEWRVKPEQVETYHFVEYMGENDVEMYSSENLKANLRLTFECKKLVKAEVIG